MADDIDMTVEQDWYEAEEEALQEIVSETTRAPSPSLIAHWAQHDRSVDYAHILNPPTMRRRRFADFDMDLLCDLNDFKFADEEERVLFGLRGCRRLDSNRHEEAGDFYDSVLLDEQHPNHMDARCVLGVWDRDARKIAAFSGSTVPNAVNMYRQVRDGKDRRRSNLLSTGCYGYIVGSHWTRWKGKPRELRGAFLLRKSVKEHRTVVTQRSYSKDMMFDVNDPFDICKPGDNIHPALKYGSDFSSAGCMTITGSYDYANHDHHGEWARFRTCAGLGEGKDKYGEPYSFVLLTGLEAVLVAQAVDEGKEDELRKSNRLRRLRYGSRGERVEALQKHLGLTADGIFGVKTAEAWLKIQQEKLGAVKSSIVSPHLAQSLSMKVF